jgi:hypothetical protein
MERRRRQGRVRELGIRCVIGCGGWAHLRVLVQLLFHGNRRRLVVVALHRLPARANAGVTPRQPHCGTPPQRGAQSVAVRHAGCGVAQPTARRADARTARGICRTFSSSTAATFSGIGSSLSFTARAGNRRKGRLSALRAHTKPPYTMYFHGKTLRNAKGA